MKRDRRHLDIHDQLAAIVRNLSYKPGSSFQLRVHTDGTFGLVLTVRVPHVYRRGEQVSVTQRQDLPARLPMEWGRLARAVFRCAEAAATAIEAHERQEWLRYDGRPVTDPHPGRRR